MESSYTYIFCRWLRCVLGRQLIRKYVRVNIDGGKNIETYCVVLHYVLECVKKKTIGFKTVKIVRRIAVHFYNYYAVLYTIIKLSYWINNN